MILSQSDKITQCIRALEEGDGPLRNDAVRELWEYFFADLTNYARRRLQAVNASRGSADEEDAAERAFTKVCGGIERGQLKLGDRDDLRKVLRSATAREVINLLHRARRGAAGTKDEFILGQVADAGLSPEHVLLAFDDCQRLLDVLENDKLRQIAIWKLSGNTNEAIRIKLGCSLATLERILAHIRETWRRKWDDVIPAGPAKSGRRRASIEVDDSAEAHRMSRITAGDATQILRGLAGFG
jgi:DNA-directed RNA polymerase specialized sigma24 family protein